MKNWPRNFRLTTKIDIFYNNTVLYGYKVGQAALGVG